MKTKHWPLAVTVFLSVCAVCDGAGLGNKKFPDMAALGFYTHSRGHKFGIFSSPGEPTCGGYPGSPGDEEPDAKTYASWGVDRLKDDWCFCKTFATERQGKLLPNEAARLKQVADEYNPLSASRQRPRPPEIAKRLKQIEEEQKQILSALHVEQREAINKEIAMDSGGRMGKALEGSGCEIVYSLCHNGINRVGERAPKVGGHLWRTNTDITPKWPAFQAVIRRQNGLEKWAGAGRGSDPDMLGMGNDEVIATNQDSLGRQAWMLPKTGEQEIWVKPLSGDRWEAAIFNLGDQTAGMELDSAELKLAINVTARDLWRQQDLPKDSPVRFEVGPHVAEMVSISTLKL